MHVRIERIVSEVEPAAAAAWWSDFREGGHDHSFFPGSSRSIVERAPDHVTMREHVVGVPWELVTAWPGEREVRFVGRNRLATFEGSYRFEPAARGTRIVLDATIRLARPIAWTDAVARPIVEAMLRVDLAGHARDMTRDLRRG